MLTIRVPEKAGNSVPQAAVLRWYRKVGEVIGKGVTLVDLQLGNQVLPIISSKAGIVENILIKEGRLVIPGDILAIVKDGLPVFDAEANIELDIQYSVSKKELSVSSQVALQELLADKSGIYALRVQSLPPKWEASPQEQENMGNEAEYEAENGLESHPLLAKKSWRKEEHRHPSDLSREEAHDKKLSLDPEYQRKLAMNSSPRPSPRPA